MIKGEPTWPGWTVEVLTRRSTHGWVGIESRAVGFKLRCVYAAGWNDGLTALLEYVVIIKVPYDLCTCMFAGIVIVQASRLLTFPSIQHLASMQSESTGKDQCTIDTV